MQIRESVTGKGNCEVIEISIIKCYRHTTEKSRNHLIDKIKNDIGFYHSVL
jgi:hypothetical protein